MFQFVSGHLFMRHIAIDLWPNAHTSAAILIGKVRYRQRTYITQCLSDLGVPRSQIFADKHHLSSLVFAFVSYTAELRRRPMPVEFCLLVVSTYLKPPIPNDTLNTYITDSLIQVKY